MCGLFGMVGFLGYKEKQALKELCFLNTLRGEDSTGLTVVNRKRQVMTRKMTVPGYDFIKYPFVDKAMSHGDQLWMGHGRYKTKGDISKENAHPFEVMDDEGNVLLVGTHNGTLTNQWHIERKLNGVKFDTDSEALFNWFVEADDYKEAVKELDGAWSLVWWDPTVDSVFWCRNKERPMTFAFTEDHKVLVYASEAWMIINACRRNGVNLAKNDKGMSCYSTLPDHLYKMEIPQGHNQVLPELVREGGYVGKPANNFQKRGMRDWGIWKQWWDEQDTDEGDKTVAQIVEEGEKEAAKGSQKTTPNREKKQNVILGFPGGGVIKGYKGANLTIAEFDKIKEKGCAWCGDPHDHGRIYSFLADDAICCSRCMRDCHPKPDGESVRRFGDDDLDDDLPFALTDKGVKELAAKSENSEDYKRLMRAASAGAAKKAVG